MNRFRIHFISSIKQEIADGVLNRTWIDHDAYLYACDAYVFCIRCDGYQRPIISGSRWNSISAHAWITKVFPEKENQNL